MVYQCKARGTQMYRNDEKLTWYTLRFNSNELDVIVPWPQLLKGQKKLSAGLINQYPVDGLV